MRRILWRVFASSLIAGAALFLFGMQHAGAAQTAELPGMDRAAQDRCFALNGTIIMQRGTATCSATGNNSVATAKGAGSSATAVGNNTVASANGAGATAVAVGDGNVAIANGNGSSATAVGERNLAVAIGNGASATAVGSKSSAFAFGPGCSAIAIGDGMKDLQRCIGSHRGHGDWSELFG